MLRGLAFLAFFCHVASASYVAISASDGSVVELDATAYFSFSQNQQDYLSLYMPARHACESIIDAQLVYSDMTYRIDDWYYKAIDPLGIAISVSIVDLSAFTTHAHQLGIWDGDPDCPTIFTRISSNILNTAFSTIKDPIGSRLFSVQNGLLVAFYCEEDVCTPEQLIEILKVSTSNQSLRLVK